MEVDHHHPFDFGFGVVTPAPARSSCEVVVVVAAAAEEEVFVVFVGALVALVSCVLLQLSRPVRLSLLWLPLPPSLLVFLSR